MPSKMHFSHNFKLLFQGRPSDSKEDMHFTFPAFEVG